MNCLLQPAEQPLPVRVVANAVDRWSCFNGATSMKTWKSRDAADWTPVTDRLQWGHVNEDVEKAATVAARRCRDLLASMGPRQ